MAESVVSLERLEHAINITAYVMGRHKLRQLLPTLKRLEAARDDFLVNGDELEYAARVLERNVTLLNCKNRPNPPLMHGAS